MKALNQNFFIVAWLLLGEVIMLAIVHLQADLSFLVDLLGEVWQFIPFHRSVIAPHVFDEEAARAHVALCTFLLPVITLTLFIIPQNRWWESEKAKQNMPLLSYGGLFIAGLLSFTPIYGTNKGLLLASSPYGFAVISICIPLFISHSIRSLGAYWSARNRRKIC